MIASPSLPTVCITGETFTQWAAALEDQAETTPPVRTFVYPDGKTILSANTTLARLGRCTTLEHVQRIVAEHSPAGPPRYRWAARGAVVTLRDRRQDASDQDAARTLWEVIQNAERLTGIAAVYVASHDERRES
jgi:hypothetical protein